MRTFTDKKDNKWNIELTVGTARKVLSECGVDLINVLDADEKSEKKSVLEQLGDNPVLLVDVLYVLCSEQAKERGIDDFAFGCLFDGNCILGATDALMEEIINFSPPMRQKVLQKIYDTSKSLMGKMEEEVTKILDDPEFEKNMEKELWNSSISSQE